MLTINDKPTIKHAIRRRLDEEGKRQVVDVGIEDGKDHIRVGVWIILLDTIGDEGLVDVQSTFELPPSFDIKHLHNEIDEIAEACKKAKTEIGIAKLLWKPEQTEPRKQLIGTGLRGQWPN